MYLLLSSPLYTYHDRISCFALTYLIFKSKEAGDSLKNSLFFFKTLIQTLLQAHCSSENILDPSPDENVSDPTPVSLNKDFRLYNEQMLSQDGEGT